MSRLLLVFACLLALSFANASCKCSGSRPASKQCADGSLSVASCASTSNGYCSWAYSRCPSAPSSTPVCNQACIRPPTCQYGDAIATRAPGSCCPTYTCPSAPAQVCTKACVRPPVCEYGEPIASGTCCPTYTCPKAPACPGEGDFCGGFAGLPCGNGNQCIDNPNDDCDPKNGGADCGGICTCTPPPKCEGEGENCGGFGNFPCSNGNQCIDNPNDSCDPLNGGADCPGICSCTPEPKCPGEGEFCGGIANLPCANGNQCVEDPNDGCDPANGGRDCGGICSCTPQPKCDGEGESCGGFLGKQCSNGNQCVDDTSDDCDPLNGGADCPGVCSCTPQPQTQPQCTGEGERCGGITGKQCSNGNQCIDDPNDSCDPANGGADCGGICSCFPQCAAPFVFSMCPSTCANCRSVTQNLLCSLACIPGCTCPEGQVLDEATNTCINPDQCPKETISCAAILCVEGSDCIEGVGCVPRTSGPNCMTIKCSAGYTCIDGKGCVKDEEDCDSVECDVAGQVCEMVSDPTCKGRYCKKVPRCVCPDCPRPSCSGACLPWETCTISTPKSSACGCPKAVCSAKPRPSCKTNYTPICDKKPTKCVYDTSVSVVDRQGCPLRCPRVICPGGN